MAYYCSEWLINANHLRKLYIACSSNHNYGKNIAVHRIGYNGQYSEYVAKNWVLISIFIGKYNALHFKELVSK